MTTEAEARRAVRHHRAAIDRGSKKADQHSAAIRRYVELFPDIQFFDFGRSTSEPNRQYQRAEAARIRTFKQRQE